MSKLLITVEHIFQITGRGVVVIPDPPPENVASDKMSQVIPVRLKRPDGSEETLEATFEWAHFNPHGYQFVCFFRGAAKEQLPPGTQIWLD